MSKNNKKGYDARQKGAEGMNANKEEKERENPQEERVEQQPDEEIQDDKVLEDEQPDYEKEIAALKESVEKEKKEYLFLMAEFDNFRKRTLKEKSEIIKNAGEQVLKGLLPIVDDMERGIQAAKNTDNAESVLQGMELIYNKLVKFLGQNGVKEIDPEDRTFDTEKHEAISAVPVADEEQKGKIIDTIEKGYTINDKVLRHAKVVVGQ